MSRLEVHTLGQFLIQVDDRTLDDKAWGREKSRVLFQYFITNRSRFTSRERIVEELWTNLDQDRALRDFKVALSGINQALQSVTVKISQTSFISRQGLSYGFNPEAIIVVDVDLFEARLLESRELELEDIQRSIALSRAALEMYGGEYLPERIYDDWTSAERERTSINFLLGATRLADMLLRANELDEAIVWSQKVISMDPLWEDAYRIQMRAHLKRGNRPMALQAYHRCREVLVRELAVEPMAITTATYLEILAA